jgi:hypothetical protein
VPDFVLTLAPPDSTGATTVVVNQWLNCAGYCYLFGRALSTLYLATQAEGR